MAGGGEKDSELPGVWEDFFGGAVGKNPLANAGDKGSFPGLRRSHVLQSN